MSIPGAVHLVTITKALLPPVHTHVHQDTHTHTQTDIHSHTPAVSPSGSFSHLRVALPHCDKPDLESFPSLNFSSLLLPPRTAVCGVPGLLTAGCVHP